MVKKNTVPEVPSIDLANYRIDKKVIDLIPAYLAEKYTLIPLFQLDNKLTIAVADPTDIVALDEVRSVAKLEISVVRANAADIKEAITGFYGIAGKVESIIRDYKPPEGGRSKLEAPTQGPLIQLVDSILSQAVNERASDIHIEPEAKAVRVRNRVDGVLHRELELPSNLLAPIISRIKVLASMNIAESRMPQDGRFEIITDGHAIDFRVSTLPSAYGEKAVLRILDKSAMVYKLPEIGFSPDNLEKFRRAVKKPHGIILVTGPTGSGKTTTLYAVLSEVDSEELNIITVEDPIEYELPGVTQSQVNTKAGMTFANVLRSILRQDPDVIMVGEIRDLETATIATQAAMTGHVVFSTLHTNDAPGAITRLIDMGVEPFLVSSSLEAVLAQRLVRRICSKCIEDIPAPPQIKERYPEVKFVKKGAGCNACNRSGYRGRVGLFELLIVNDDIRKLITDKVAASEIRQYAVKHGMKLLYDDGLEKVKEGRTTLEEVLRVTELE